MKSIRSKFKNEEGGFLQLIILIIVVILLMKYFHITVTEIINWVKSVF